MRKRRIERALLLGLVLSTSIYGTSFAAEQSIDEFRNSAVDKVIKVTEDTIVMGNDEYGGGGHNNNALDDMKIEVSNGANLTLNNIHDLKPNIIGDGNININVTTDKANTAGIHVNGNITANSLKIDTSEATSVKGIYTYGGDVNINVNKLDINAYSHAIFTTPEEISDVNINNAQTVNLKSLHD